MAHMSMGGASRRILIVEDERISAEVTANVLEKLGFTVAAILSTGEEAVAFAHEHKPDLVLMDISLPGELDGIEAASRIFAADRIPIIFLTATIDSDVLRRVQASEGAGYIHKPVKLLDLKANLELALNKKKAAPKAAPGGKPRLVESDLVLAMELDALGEPLFLSRSLVRLLGLPDPGGALKMDEVMDVRAYPVQFENLAAQASEGRVDGFEAVLVTSLGQELAVDVSAQSLGPDLVEAVLSPAEARLEAEDQAGRMLDFLQALLEDNRDAAWVLEPDGTIVFANDKAQRLFSAKGEDLCGLTCFSLAHGAAGAPEDCPRALDEQGQAGLPCRFRLGKLKARCVVREVRDPQGGMLGFVGRIQVDKR